MQAKTVAVLVVKSPKVFSWLGHMPVMNWSFQQLAEVRGVDQVVCVAEKSLAKRAGQMLSKDDVTTVAIPDGVLKQQGDSHLDRWLAAVDGPAALADVICVVRPTLPFLPAAKIEGCIDLVKRNFADTTCTVQEVNAWTSYGRSQAFAEVPGCRTFAPARMPERGYGRFRPVPVSLIESLDVTDADNHRIAKALIESNA